MECADTRTIRPQSNDDVHLRGSSWLAQIEQQAQAIPQPVGCLPVAVGMQLDQLLTKLRLAADIEATESPDRTEKSLRALPDAALWFITEHLYENLDVLVEQLKWRWQEENAEFAERAYAWKWRRQGWFLLLGVTEEGSVLVSADRQHVFLVRGMEQTLSSKLRKTLSAGEQSPSLPAAVWLTLLPWEGYISFDGLLACHALPDDQKAAVQRELQPLYALALDQSAGKPADGKEATGGKEGAGEKKAGEKAGATSGGGAPQWMTRAFGGDLSIDAALRDGDGDGDGDEMAAVHRQLSPGLARYDTHERWPGEAVVEGGGGSVMPLLSRAAKADADAAFKRQKYARAVRLYSAALSSFPPKGKDGSGEAVLLANRSLCHLRLGEAATALSDALATTIGAPGWAKGHARKAMALQALGEHAPALEAIEQALRLAPDDAAFAKMKEGIRRELPE